MKKRIGVLLSGCGVYDGSEIHEAVLTLLAIAENDANAVCIAPNIDQHHVIDHTNGNEMPEKRSVLVEAARIARGEIKDLAQIQNSDLDALVIVGGFGAAKNLTQWAFKGSEGSIQPEVQRIISEMNSAKKPIVGLCMGPTVIAKALEESGKNPLLTVGTNSEPSPYDIAGISKGMEQIGAKTEMTSGSSILIDRPNLIITAPCYMMEAGIMDVRNNIKMAIDGLFDLMADR